MAQKIIPHINLSSYPGGGKTTLTKILLDEYSAILIPKFTTRPKRPIEEIPEYIFVDMEEFTERKNLSQFIAIEEIERFGEKHYHAIPKPEFWPIIPSGTRLIVSVFGIYAHLVKKYIPHMKLCFIDFKNKEILKHRLYERCLTDGSDFNTKLAVIEKYIAENLSGNYEHIIYNDHTEIESIEQILKLI